MMLTKEERRILLDHLLHYEATVVDLERRVAALQHEAELNASMLAKQCDLAREAEQQLAEKDAQIAVLAEAAEALLQQIGLGGHKPNAAIRDAMLALRAALTTDIQQAVKEYRDAVAERDVHIAVLVEALSKIAQHDGGRWMPDDDGLPSVRQPSPQDIAAVALEPQ